VIFFFWLMVCRAEGGGGKWDGNCFLLFFFCNRINLDNNTLLIANVNI